jgi:hypothetical protein
VHTSAQRISRPSSSSGGAIRHTYTLPASVVVASRSGCSVLNAQPLTPLPCLRQKASLPSGLKPHTVPSADAEAMSCGSLGCQATLQAAVSRAGHVTSPAAAWRAVRGGGTCNVWGPTTHPPSTSASSKQAPTGVLPT